MLFSRYNTCTYTNVCVSIISGLVFPGFELDNFSNKPEFINLIQLDTCKSRILKKSLILYP